MTIAAGIIHNDGILLCSDSQVEFGGLKSYGPKLGYFATPDGVLAFALAGHLHFGLSAIQKCKRALSDAGGQKSFDVIEATLKYQYEDIVFGHPSYKDNPYGSAYWFLLALFSEEDGLKLFATSDNTIREIHGYECIGIGQDMARSILGPAIRQSVGQREAMVAAAYTLAKVKGCVPGCGGPTSFLAIKNDGLVNKELDPFPITNLADNSALFDWSARRLFMAVSDSELTDSEFDDRINVFISTARHLRVQYQKAGRGSEFEKQLRSLNPDWELK